MAHRLKSTRYRWDRNPESILDTIDLHLRFRLFRRTDKVRQTAVKKLAAKIGIPLNLVAAAVDAVGTVDPEVLTSSPKTMGALRILWNLHPKASRTPAALPPLKPKATALLRRIQEALEYLRPGRGTSVLEQSTREELVALLCELFRIDEHKAESVAARLLQ